MNDPDIPTVAASQASGLSVDHVRSAVEQHRRGFRHLPGTGYHVAVVAWQAARLALELERARMSDIAWANVTVKLSDLLPWTGNPKTSTGKNAQQLQTSHDELGQFQTVAIEPTDKPNVYQVADGHQRLSAWLAKYGKAAEIDARLASRPLTETERRKIAIYSRQIGAWDWDMLSGWEPDELTGWGFDVDLLQDWRRDVAALGNFLESEEEQAQGDAEPQTNRAEELRELWGVELGQMWRLPSRTEGQEHRLICGDCTDAAVVDMVMGGEKADLVFADPPYNVKKDYGGATNDDMTLEEYRAWSLLWFLECKKISDSISFTPGAVNVWMWAEIERPKWMAIWAKKNQVSRNGAGGFNAYEPILCYGKVKIDYDLWDIPVKQENVSHPVPKTVKAWQTILEAILHAGTIVYDPFGGSGTTMVASENLGRQCRMVEIEPSYCAVILQRMVDAFGIRAELVE